MPTGDGGATVSNSTQEPTSAAAALAAQRPRRWTETMLRRLLDLLRGQSSTKRQRQPAERSPRDHSLVGRLADCPGELWVGFRTGDDDAADEAALEGLVEHVESSGLGEWSGQSIGAGQRDVTFDVRNQRRVGRLIAAHFARHLPTRDFWISTDYQSTFDRV